MTSIIIETEIHQLGAPYKSFRELSRDDAGNANFISSLHQALSLDEVAKSQYRDRPKETPKTPDALLATPNQLILIEFKNQKKFQRKHLDSIKSKLIDSLTFIHKFTQSKVGKLDYMSIKKTYWIAFNDKKNQPGDSPLLGLIEYSEQRERIECFMKKAEGLMVDKIIVTRDDNDFSLTHTEIIKN